jgi:hypothetical protein
MIGDLERRYTTEAAATKDRIEAAEARVAAANQKVDDERERFAIAGGPRNDLQKAQNELARAIEDREQQVARLRALERLAGEAREEQRVRARDMARTAAVPLRAEAEVLARRWPLALAAFEAELLDINNLVDDFNLRASPVRQAGGVVPVIDPPRASGSTYRLLEVALGKLRGTFPDPADEVHHR